MSGKFYSVVYKEMVLKKYLSLVKANKLILKYVKEKQYSLNDFKIVAG